MSKLMRTAIARRPLVSTHPLVKRQLRAGMNSGNKKPEALPARVACGDTHATITRNVRFLYTEVKRFATTARKPAAGRQQPDH